MHIHIFALSPEKARSLFESFLSAKISSSLKGKEEIKRVKEIINFKPVNIKLLLVRLSEQGRNHIQPSPSVLCNALTKAQQVWHLQTPSHSFFCAIQSIYHSSEKIPL